MKLSLPTTTIIVLLVMAPVFEGCAPIPHYAIVSPAVTGMVHRNGKPVENALVYLEHPMGENCAFTSDVVTRTDSEGQFYFAVRKEFRLIVFMDPTQNWQVCIVDGDKRYQGWYKSGLGGPPPEVYLDCNVEGEPHVRQIGNSMGKIMGICTVNSKYN
jgi:hypothetical protein